MKRKIAAGLLILVECFVLASCGQASEPTVAGTASVEDATAEKETTETDTTEAETIGADTESESIPTDAESEENGSITGVGDLDWGADFESAVSQVITADMNGIIVDNNEFDDNGDYDYIVTRESGGSVYDGELEVIYLKKAEFAGYEAELAYLFADEKLVSGVYLIDMGESGHDEIKDSITQTYGDAVIYKEYSDLCLWVDGEKNYIGLESERIVFSQAGYYITGYNTAVQEEIER